LGVIALVLVVSVVASLRFDSAAVVADQIEIIGLEEPPPPQER
jgi:hypothetical protein